MSARLSLSHLIAASIGLVAVLFAVGWTTRQDPAEAPYLKILGGGFMFNYRVADVYFGFTAAVMRPLPTGSIIEAVFEDPAGGPGHVVRQRVGTDTERYALRSPPVRGVKAGQPYRVDIKVMNRQETAVLWTHGLAFKSQIDDTVVPDQPLTIGPGYARNPGG